MLRGISARFQCDGCNTEKVVYMDPALEVNGGSLMEAAEHELKSELDFHVADGGNHLCDKCRWEERGEDD